MNTFRRISPKEAYEIVKRKGIVLDIRQLKDYRKSHIIDSVHLTSQTIRHLIEYTDLDTELVVSCYHGHSSQIVAAYLSERGFRNVYSLDGGFNIWSLTYPLKVNKEFTSLYS